MEDAVGLIRDDRPSPDLCRVRAAGSDTSEEIDPEGWMPCWSSDDACMMSVRVVFQSSSASAVVVAVLPPAADVGFVNVLCAAIFFSSTDWITLLAGVVWVC